MEQQLNITDLVQQIGEALGLIVIAIAQEHDAPLQLLDAMQHAVAKCNEHQALFSPVTRDLVRYAAVSLEGAIQAASGPAMPN